MSKVVVAINVMIVQREKISSVLQGEVEGEIFFVYDNKHKWSLLYREGNYTLFYYPGGQNISYLSSVTPDNWDETLDMVSYRSRDIGTKEAKESFAELYSILKEKRYGMDEVLDDIILSDIPF